MAVKFQKIVRALVVFLAAMLVLSGCQKTTTAPEKTAVKTTKSQEKKTDQKEKKKPEQKTVKETEEPQKEEEEEKNVEAGIEKEVEKEVEQPSNSKTASSSKESSTQGSKPAPQQSQDSEEQTCYLKISCHTILNNMDQLEAGKEVLIPSNGVLYAQREVTFQEGETVFDVLLRETKKSGIHMEYSFTPGFNSNYIEGIGNIYEMDCGPNSGWMYSVNGVYPDYGCSAYELKDQDVIEWNYTCDLGRDL